MSDDQYRTFELSDDADDSDDDDDSSEGGFSKAEYMWLMFAKGALAVLADPNVRFVPDMEDRRYPTSAIGIAADAATLMCKEFEQRFPSRKHSAGDLVPEALLPSLLS